MSCAWLIILSNYSMFQFITLSSNQVHIKFTYPSNTSAVCAQLLMYHISPGAHTTSEIPPGPPTPIETLLPGQKIEVSKSSPTGPFLVQVSDQTLRAI